jgi:DNA-binding LytR/AlgR family response regulator
MEVVKTVPYNEYFDLKKEVDYLRSLVSELSDKLNILDKQDNKEFGVKCIFIKKNGLSRYVNIKDIIMIKAESNYSYLYLINGESFLTSKTLKYWQEKCAVPFLQRIHKSYLINTVYIVSTEPKTGTVNLINGHIASYSRSSKLK